MDSKRQVQYGQKVSQKNESEQQEDTKVIEARY